MTTFWSEISDTNIILNLPLLFPELNAMDESEERRRFGSKDAEEVAEIFETLSTQLPKMIRGILDSLFSPQAAASMGKAVAEFYKNLKEGGIPEEEAIAMTKNYLSTLTSWGEMMKSARGSKWLGAKHFQRKEEEEE